MKISPYALGTALLLASLSAANATGLIQLDHSQIGSLINQSNQLSDGGNGINGILGDALWGNENSDPYDFTKLSTVGLTEFEFQTQAGSYILGTVSWMPFNSTFDELIGTLTLDTVYLSPYEYQYAAGLVADFAVGASYPIDLQLESDSTCPNCLKIDYGEVDYASSYPAPEPTTLAILASALAFFWLRHNGRRFVSQCEVKG